jgi:hypothetical protein
MATGGAAGFLSKGLLSTGIESMEAAPSVLGAAQRLLNNPVTVSLNPTIRGIATGIIEGAAGMNGYNATQSYMQGTKYSTLESTEQGAAFGLGGALLGKVFSKLTGNGADWNTANSSDVQRATESARGQANTTLAKAAEDAKNTEEFKQAQETQQAQQQQADMQDAVQSEAVKKAQYDAMPFEDKLNAQPEANIETVPMQDANSINTVPRQDANGNIIPDRTTESSIYNNMKNNTDMEDEISKLPPDQQQSARDYLDEKNMQNSSNADRQAGSIGKNYQENSVNDLIDAKKAMEDLDHQDNIVSKLEELGYPKDSKTFRDKLATDEFPTESYSDYMKRKTFDRKYSNLEQQDAYDKALSEDKINPIDEVKGNFTTKDDLLEKFKKADDNNEASLSSDFKNVFNLAGEMEHKKKMLQEKGVSGAEAEKIIKTYHGDDKYFKDAQAIRDSLNKEPMNFNNPLPKLVKEVKTTSSEDMQKLNELSQNPHFNEHLNERENIQAKDIRSSQKLISKRNGNEDYQTGALTELNPDARFGITTKDVTSIRKALADGKINDTASDALSNLSHDLELRSREHSAEYDKKKIDTLYDPENQKTMGNTTLDRRKAFALDKISKADEMTGEGQRQIDDGIKELNDVKAERDKMIVKDWSDKVGSDKEVKEFADNLNLADKIMNCKG